MPSFGNLSALLEVDLSYNNFIGSLPAAAPPLIDSLQSLVMTNTLINQSLALYPLMRFNKLQVLILANNNLQGKQCSAFCYRAFHLLLCAGTLPQLGGWMPLTLDVLELQVSLCRSCRAVPWY